MSAFPPATAADVARLASDAHDALLARRATVALAESLTGGLVCAALADEDFAGFSTASQHERGDDVTQRLGCGLRSAAVQLANGFLHVCPV